MVLIENILETSGDSHGFNVKSNYIFELNGQYRGCILGLYRYLNIRNYEILHRFLFYMNLKVWFPKIWKLKNSNYFN